MNKAIKIIIHLLILLNFASCVTNQDPKATTSDLLVARGDIVAVSFNNDSLVVFDQNGTFKRVLYQLPTPSEAIGGIAWLHETNEILITIESAPDRIDALSVTTGLTRTFYSNVNYFTGTSFGITQLVNSRDVIVSEGATIERFSHTGVRKTSSGAPANGWPTNVHANPQQMSGLKNGNWLSCSSTAGIRISPDSTTSLTAVATVTGPVGATASYGCAELSNGNIIVGWNGASADYIYSYSSTLTSPVALVDNTQSTLSDPRNIAVGEYDQIYIADTAQNKIVELDSSGNVVRQFGNSILNAPRYLLVIPQFH